MSASGTNQKPKMARFKIEYDIGVEFVFESADHAQLYADAVLSAVTSEVEPRTIWLKLPLSACRLLVRSADDGPLAVVFGSAQDARAWSEEIKVAHAEGCEAAIRGEYDLDTF